MKNIKLLEKVKKHILEEPRRLNMSSGIKKVQKRKVPCGTIGCIAGWSVLLSKSLLELTKDLEIDEEKGWMPIEQDAQELLGISDLQKGNLFYLHNWPSKFQLTYKRAKTANGRARATAKRIDYFIKFGK